MLFTYDIQRSTLGYLRRELCVSTCKEKIIWNILMTCVMCLHLSVQEEEVLEHTNAKCQLCTPLSTGRPMCDISIHLITLLNILMPRYQDVHLNANYHEVALMMKLLVTSVTWQRPHNKVSDTNSHATLNTINGVLARKMLVHICQQPLLHCRTVPLNLCIKFGQACVQFPPHPCCRKSTQVQTGADGALWPLLLDLHASKRESFFQGRFALVWLPSYTFCTYYCGPL